MLSPKHQAKLQVLKEVSKMMDGMMSSKLKPSAAHMEVDVLPKKEDPEMGEDMAKEHDEVMSSPELHLSDEDKAEEMSEPEEEKVMEMEHPEMEEKEHGLSSTDMLKAKMADELSHDSMHQEEKPKDDMDEEDLQRLRDLYSQLK